MSIADHQIVRHHFLIVPAWSDQAGQCSIVYRATDPDIHLGLSDYRRKPDLWSDVGLMNSRGRLVALSAWPGVFKDMRESEPLMASNIMAYNASALDVANLTRQAWACGSRDEPSTNKACQIIQRFCYNDFWQTTQTAQWLAATDDYDRAFDAVIQGLREYDSRLIEPELCSRLKHELAFHFMPSQDAQAAYESLRDAVEGKLALMDAPDAEAMPQERHQLSHSG